MSKWLSSVWFLSGQHCCAGLSLLLCLLSAVSGKQALVAMKHRRWRLGGLPNKPWSTKYLYGQSIYQRSSIPFKTFWSHLTCLTQNRSFPSQNGTAHHYLHLQGVVDFLSTSTLCLPTDSLQATLWAEAMSPEAAIADIRQNSVCPRH